MHMRMPVNFDPSVVFVGLMARTNFLSDRWESNKLEHLYFSRMKISCSDNQTEQPTCYYWCNNRCLTEPLGWSALLNGTHGVLWVLSVVV